MSFDILREIELRRHERADLHTTHLNAQLVRVLRTIGYDVEYVRGEGQYLYDKVGNRYLDLLSGFGVFALGRNHPTVVKALDDILHGGLPNLVQLDVSVLAGLFAERLLPRLAGMDNLFCCNSGAEAVEAAIKFARAATGRAGILYCEHGFHGLTYGSLSLNGDRIFREGFGPLLPECRAVPFNDLEALERELRKGDLAAFIVEPIQGKGVNLPSDDYLRRAAALCRQHGTLFVADEIQTGVGRTGRFLAIDHWGVEPDMVLLAKALSGGFIPIGVVATRRWIFEKVFDRMDRAVVHGSTFSKNDMAMAAALATLHVLDEERLVERAEEIGDSLRSHLATMVGRHEFVKAVRGKGMMLGIEFGSPRRLALKAAWAALEQANKGLFCQMITIPLFKRHRILTQVAGHASHVVKLLPPLVLSGDDCRWIGDAFEDVVSDSHRVPGAIWDLGRTLAGHAVKARAGAG